MLWVQMHTYLKQWRPFLVGVLPEQATANREGWNKVVEEDIEEFELHELDAVAYYAAWPVQAHIEGFTVSNAITLTYTHMDAWDL